ncbi:glycosyltransferase family 4 protein [candidate division WOR-3 bacterium]|nr:glycosyltransferase family 4 protein [candidate division WOR-3 bacterium]
MRIAYDVTNPYSSGSTGIGTYSKALIETMIELFPDNEYLLCIRDSRVRKILGDREAFIKNRIKSYNVSHRIALKGFLVPPKRPDIWHGLDVWIPDKFTGTSKIVLTVHDLVVFSRPDLLKENYVKSIRRKFERYFNSVSPDSVIAISRQTADEVSRFFPSFVSKIHIIPQGVSGFWKPSHRKHPFGGKFKYFLFVSTLEPRKNFKAAREAFLSLGLENVKLVVVGKDNGEDRNLFDDDRILRLGYCDRDYIRTLYTYSHGLLFTSIYEGFGLPPLEALSCGCPVIAEKSLPCSEFLPEDFKTDCFDIDLLSKKILFLLDFEGRKKLPEIVSGLTWENTARKTFGVYEETMSK